MWIEKAYDYPPMHVLLQGHLITLTFFLISGFLLAYNFQLIAEKTKFTWKLLPRAILNRFLRVTPICIMALLLTATLMRHTTQGPFWEEIIGWEVRDCRNYWFYNLFYLNNYIDHSQCILQTWYLACDMHLHIIGMAVIVLSPSTRVRWWVMGALYVIGTLWPAYHIYSMDLDATLLANPSTMTSFFISNPTFNYIYKRTHGNMPTFITGMALGYLVYDWQKKNIFSKDLSRYRKFYLLLFPLLLLVTTSAGMLYCGNRPRAPVWARLLFAPIVKPMFVACVSLTLLGAMFKIDRIYRQSLVWRPWTPLARISYCIFSFHVMVLRFLGGTRTTLNYLSYSHTTHDYIGVTILTIIMATVCYLLVEAPFAQLVRILLSSKPRQKAAVNGANANEAVGNGAAANGIAGNGTVSNGTVEAVVKNGTANGTAVNGISANGTTLNGTSFNGSALNGHALTEQVTTGKDKDA
ncbi:nose resistant to fluoxetine protein 6-like [Ostrinia furnacalis]|uniref:nose resistant to fluoxetine protein 6-like n=1 Tax=Ostrinia furnacalis TaxID=93504 RepID=UPI00103EB91A|nr:nose resistant to fluoxetine protein 6-like [Ostrinia furnacalis]